MAAYRTPSRWMFAGDGGNFRSRTSKLQLLCLAFPFSCPKAFRPLWRFFSRFFVLFLSAPFDSATIGFTLHFSSSDFSPSLPTKPSFLLLCFSFMPWSPPSFPFFFFLVFLLSNRPSPLSLFSSAASAVTRFSLAVFRSLHRKPSLSVPPSANFPVRRHFLLSSLIFTLSRSFISSPENFPQLPCPPPLF